MHLSRATSSMARTMLLGALTLPLVLAACPSSRVNIVEATKVLSSSDGCPRLNVGGHKEPSIEQVKALAQALASNSDVQELTVGNDREHARDFGVHTATKYLGDEGMRVLAEEGLNHGGARRGHPSLKVLHIGANWVGPAGAKALAEALTNGGTGVLETLFIGNNDIMDEGVEAIAKALSPSPSPASASAKGAPRKRLSRLSGLHLRQVKCGDKGAAALGAMLVAQAKAASSTTFASEHDYHALHTLGVGSNDIGDDGAKAFAHALNGGSHMAGGKWSTAPSVLRRLGIFRNKIGEAGGEALAKALHGSDRLADEGDLHAGRPGKVNTMLQVLDASFNDMGPRAAVAFASMLAHNGHLLEFMISGQSAAPGGLEWGKKENNVIAEALITGNGVLVKLDIARELYHQRQRDEIMHRLKANALRSASTRGSLLKELLRAERQLAECKQQGHKEL